MARRRAISEPLWKRALKKTWHTIDGPLAIGAIGTAGILLNEYAWNNWLASNYDWIRSEWGKQGYRAFEIGERMVVYSPIGILGYKKIEDAVRSTGIGARLYDSIESKLTGPVSFINKPWKRMIATGALVGALVGYATPQAIDDIEEWWAKRPRPKVTAPAPVLAPRPIPRTPGTPVPSIPDSEPYVPPRSSTPVIEPKLVDEALADLTSNRKMYDRHGQPLIISGKHATKKDYLESSLNGALKFKPLVERVLRMYASEYPDIQRYPTVDADFIIALIGQESGGRNVCSPKAACGIFQYIPNAAREEGLKVTKYIDDRNDPEKAARAAIKRIILSTIKFQSPEFAAASYNAGYVKLPDVEERPWIFDFWNERHRYREETRKYVPEILARRRALKNSEKYGFRLRTDGFHSLPPHRLHVTSRRDSPQSIAEAYGIKLGKLFELNPSFTKEYLRNPDVKLPMNYQVRIPLDGRLARSALSSLDMYGGPVTIANDKVRHVVIPFTSEVAMLVPGNPNGEYQILKAAQIFSSFSRSR